MDATSCTAADGAEMRCASAKAPLQVATLMLHERRSPLRFTLRFRARCKLQNVIRCNPTKGAVA